MNEAIRSGDLRGRKAFGAGGGPVGIPTDSNSPAAPRVADNWPDLVPIGSRELDALETFLAPLLDEILGGAHVGK